MAISSWGQYDTAGLTKQSQGSGYSGSNNGYAIYTNGQDGVSYDQVASMYRKLIARDQTYLDPESLAGWAIVMGFKPNFGDPQRLQVIASNIASGATGEFGIDGAVIGNFANKLGFTPDDIKKNARAFLSGDWSQASSSPLALKELPEAEAAKIKALQDYGASIEAQKQGVVANPQNGQSMQQNQQSTQNPIQTSSSVQSTNGSNQVNNIQNALDVINNSGLDEGTKALFRQVVGDWDPDLEINTENIIKEFNNIKQTTIDPFFQEQANIFIDDVKRARTFAEGERQRELEIQNTNANQNIQNAQNSLEARGMTFSGEGVAQLGNKSAYAQEGTPEAQQSAIPTFGGQMPEGFVNQQNRLFSSSSSARYMKSLTDLARNAEQQLGSAQSQGLIPGVQQMGNITGQLPQQKTQAEASTLSNLSDQERFNKEARQPLKVL